MTMGEVGDGMMTIEIEGEEEIDMTMMAGTAGEEGVEVEVGARLGGIGIEIGRTGIEMTSGSGGTSDVRRKCLYSRACIPEL